MLENIYKKLSKNLHKKIKNPTRKTIVQYKTKNVQSSLNFSGHQLVSIPNNIFSQQEAQDLWLDDNIIKEIPSSIIGLTKLRRLSLYKNCLESLPEAIFQLNSLERLNISMNKISSLSSNI